MFSSILNVCPSINVRSKFFISTELYENDVLG
jgi:hypothetical protein